MRATRYHSLAASLAFAAALSGIELVVAAPDGFRLDDAVVDRARNLGGVVEQTGDPYEAVRDADVIAAADKLGLAMVFTGVRHFRH